MPHRPAVFSILLTYLLSEPNTYCFIFMHFNFQHYIDPVFKASEYQMRKSSVKWHISHIAEKPSIPASFKTDRWRPPGTLWWGCLQKPTDSVTRRYFHNYTLLFKGLLPLLTLWHSNLWPCSHHQESGLLDNGGPCSQASNPVIAQPSLARARRWAAEPTEEPSSSQSSLPSWKLEADYIRAVMHNC